MLNYVGAGTFAFIVIKFGSSNVRDMPMYGKFYTYVSLPP